MCKHIYYQRILKEQKNCQTEKIFEKIFFDNALTSFPGISPSFLPFSQFCFV